MDSLKPKMVTYARSFFSTGRQLIRTFVPKQALVKVPWEKDLHITIREVSSIYIHRQDSELRFFVLVALSRDRERGEKGGEGGREG